MPVVRVHRGVISQIISGVGTQTIADNGAFQLNGEVVFELDPTLFTLPGTYILVDYSASGAQVTWATGGYATVQEALNARATVDASDLLNLTPTSAIPVDDAVNRWITVTLS